MITAFLRRNKAFVSLAISTNLEYRFNYFLDAIAQPLIACVGEVIIWKSIFTSSGHHTIGGFTMPYYIAYAIWSSFLGRISTNWFYESLMTQEVESGGLNTLLLRPMSFFEYYLSQFLGYKIFTALISLWIPFAIIFWLDLPGISLRIFPAMGLTIYYLVFLFLLSFLVTTLAFHLTQTRGITAGKNISLLVLSGDLLPLDLFPEPYKTWLLHLPFSSGGFLPVGYLTGRVDTPTFISGFTSITLGILVLGFCAIPLWKFGLRQYTGIRA